MKFFEPFIKLKETIHNNLNWENMNNSIAGAINDVFICKNNFTQILNFNMLNDSFFLKIYNISYSIKNIELFKNMSNFTLPNFIEIDLISTIKLKNTSSLKEFFKDNFSLLSMEGVIKIFGNEKTGTFDQIKQFAINNLFIKNYSDINIYLSNDVVLFNWLYNFHNLTRENMFYNHMLDNLDPLSTFIDETVVNVNYINDIFRLRDLYPTFKNNLE